MNDHFQETVAETRRVRAFDLWLVLAANGLFALFTNLLFLFDTIKPLKTAENLWTPLLLGMGVYGIQIGLIWYLVRTRFDRFWLTRPVLARDWYWGIGIGLLVWIVANGTAALRIPEAYLRPNSVRGFTRFTWIFVFNSVPGALIEEYLFRYLPVRYAEYKGLSRRRTILLFLIVLIFFTATHIPAYLWQYNLSLLALWSPFTMGAAFFFVYYATRNLPFATLFHAFSNQSWMLFGSANVKDYSFVIVVSIIWFFMRTNRAHFSSQWKGRAD